jgi:hypothetical protein
MFEYDTFDPSTTQIISLGTGYYKPLAAMPAPKGLIATIEFATTTLMDSSEDLADQDTRRVYPACPSRNSTRRSRPASTKRISHRFQCYSRSGRPRPPRWIGLHFSNEFRLAPIVPGSVHSIGCAYHMACSLQRVRCWQSRFFDRPISRRGSVAVGADPLKVEETTVESRGRFALVAP